MGYEISRKISVFDRVFKVERLSAKCNHIFRRIVVLTRESNCCPLVNEADSNFWGQMKKESLG